jgi:DNA-3-methyladenine glycosylase II
MLRWFLSLHSPADNFTIAADKLPKPPDDEQETEGKATPAKTPSKRRSPRKPEHADDDAAAVPQADTEATTEPGEQGTPVVLRGSSPDVSSVPPAPVPATPAVDPNDGDATDPEAKLRLPALPTPFTPSIEITLNAGVDLKGDGDGDDLPTLAAPNGKTVKRPVPLPDGLTVAGLRSRLQGKKKIKCARS